MLKLSNNKRRKLNSNTDDGRNISTGIQRQYGTQRLYQFFGPQFPLQGHAYAKTQVSYTINSSSGSGDNWKGNSFYLAGPQFNNTGAFTSNVPSGLSYLLSSDSAAGATAPYSRYNIVASRITYRILPTAVNTGPCRFALFPSTVTTTAGMGFSQASEQPYSVNIDVPAVQTNKPTILSNFMTTSKIYGVSDEVQKIPDFRGTANSDPVNLWYWHAVMVSADGSSDVNLSYDVVIEYVVQFDQRNQFSTTTPS